MDENSQLTGPAAVAEIKRIQEDESHPDHTAWISSEPAALQKVSELWRASSTEDSESAKQPPAEAAKEPAEEPEKELAKEDTPEATVEDQEAQAKKDWGIEQLQNIWGEHYDREGEKVGRMVNTIVNFSDPEEAEFFDVVSEKLGNNATWINSLAIFAGSLPLGSRPIDVSKFSKAERDELFEKADAHWQFKKSVPQMPKVFENWVVRAAALKFRPPEFPPEEPDTKPAPPPVDPKKAKAAQVEIDEIYSGKHRLSEAWKRGESSARAYLRSLFQATTGEK